MALVEQPLSRLGWEERSELGWWELVGLGLPSQLAELAIDMSRRAGRRLRIFVMPTRDAGVVGLTVPFLDEDWIAFDTSLLDQSSELANVVAHELAYLLYPGWLDPQIEEYGQMEEFASVLGPIILDKLPIKALDTDAIVNSILSNQERRRWTASRKPPSGRSTSRSSITARHRR